jgi:hypothetical protein
MTDIDEATLTPPSLPTDAREFHAAAGPIALPWVTEGTAPAMETLGPAPFPKSRFPFLGFLASVYEHIANHARARVGDREPPPQG